jgi:hypothetical protein
MRKWMVGVCAVLAVCRVSAEVELATIPAGTQWLLEVDLRAMSESKFASRIGAELTSGGPAVKAVEQLGTFKAATGIDLVRDIDSIVVHGRTIGDRTGVAMIRGRWDAARIEELVAQRRDFGSKLHANQKIFSWMDQQPMHLCLAEPELAVLSSNEGQLIQALETLNGRQPGLSADSPLARFNTIAQRPLLAFFATGVNTAPRVQARAGGFKQAETLRFSLVEPPGVGTLVSECRVGLVSVESSGQMVQMLEGMRAMAQMQHAERPALLALIGALKVTASGSDVTLRMTIDEPLVEALKQLSPPRTGGAAVPE